MTFLDRVRQWLKDDEKVEQMAARAGLTAADLRKEWETYVELEEAKLAKNQKKIRELTQELIAIQRR